MGIISCKVFRVEYKENKHDNYENAILVLADSMEEALDIFKEKYPQYDIKGIHTYIPVIRRTTKTITIDI